MCWLVSAYRLRASALTVRPPTIVPGAASRAAAHSSRSHPGLGHAVVVGEREQLPLRRARAVVAGGAGTATLAPPPAAGSARQPSGRNRGARQARGEIIVFVDSDVRVHPDAFARIRKAFGDDPELTALFGAYDDDPACRQTVSQFRNLLHHHVHRRAAGDAYAPPRARHA
jgi:hypothetical protein